MVSTDWIEFFLNNGLESTVLSYCPRRPAKIWKFENEPMKNLCFYTIFYADQSLHLSYGLWAFKNKIP